MNRAAGNCYRLTKMSTSDDIFKQFGKVKRKEMLYFGLIRLKLKKNDYILVKMYNIFY